VVQGGKYVRRLKVAKDAALEERALERGELPAAVAPVDLRHVRELDGGGHDAGRLTRPPRMNLEACRKPSSRRGRSPPTRRRAPAAPWRVRRDRGRTESPGTTPRGA